MCPCVCVCVCRCLVVCLNRLIESAEVDCINNFSASILFSATTGFVVRVLDMVYIVSSIVTTRGLLTFEKPLVVAYAVVVVVVGYVA